MTRAGIVLALCLLTPAIGRAQEAPEAKQRPVALTTAEQTSLDALLRVWQASCQSVKTVHGEVDAWVDDPAFNKRTHRRGEFVFQAPAESSLRLTTDVASKKPQPLAPAEQEDWTWIEKSMFLSRHEDKKVIEFTSGPARASFDLMQNPLRALFHVDPAALKARYVLRETSSDRERAKGEYWLVAIPRSDEEGTSSTRIEIILNEVEFERRPGLRGKLTLPSAIKYHLGGTYSEAYVFGKREINRWTEIPCSHAFRPHHRLRPGWTHEVQSLEGLEEFDRAIRKSTRCVAGAATRASWRCVS